MSKCFAFSLIVVVSVQLGSGRVQAEGEPASDPTSDVARAEGYAAEAFEAYSRQDFPRAVSLYQQALAASPSPDIIYNLARIYDTKLKDRSRAIEFYQRYAADPGADPERERTVMERLAKLRELERIGSESKRASARHDSHDAHDANEAAQHAETAAAPASPAKPESGLSGVQIASLVVGAVGVAGVGVGIGFGLDAKSKADLSHDQCDGNLCISERGVDAAKHASNSATVSTIAFIAGGALVATGVTMLILSSGGQEHESIALIVPYADRYGGGTQIVGRW